MMAEATIHIGEALEGMVLSKSLLDSNGAILLPEGASLNASNLASLTRRGVEQLQVVAEAPAPDPAALQAERERQCQRLEHLFRHCAASGGSAQLLARLLNYRKGGAHGDRNQ